MTVDNRGYSYLPGAFDSTKMLVDNFRKAVHANGRVRFDTLIGTGLSGALVVPILARALRKHYMIIRKPGDDSHAGGQHEGILGERFIFVDDFISTGTTMRRVLRQVQEMLIDDCEESQFVGVYEYEPREGAQRWTLPGNKSRRVTVPRLWDDKLV